MWKNHLEHYEIQFESNIQLKLKNVLEKNGGLSLLKKISYVLSGTGDIEKLNGFLEEISSRGIPYFL